MLCVVTPLFSLIRATCTSVVSYLDLSIKMTFLSSLGFCSLGFTQILRSTPGLRLMMSYWLYCICEIVSTVNYDVLVL